MTEPQAPRTRSKLVISKEQLSQTRREFIEWVDHILDRKKWTATDLANQSGMAPSTILRIMNSKTHDFNISFMTIRKIAEGSGYPIPRALMEAHEVKNVPDSTSMQPKSRHTAPRQAAPHEARTIPVRYVSSLPASLVQSPREDVYEACPSQMLNDDTAFAFRMPDDALMPMVRGGMMMYATKRRDPSAGDIVLLVDNSGRSKVRLVTDVSEGGIAVRRLCVDDTEVASYDDIKDFGIVDGLWLRS